MKVLLIDDDELVLPILSTIVRQAGHELRTAGNGREGLAVFEEFRPDVVLSDIEMPELDGLELLARIREKSEDAIVVMATGSERMEYVTEALRLRANDFLRKPVEVAELTKLLRKYEVVANERRLHEQILGMVLSRELTIQFDNRVELTQTYVNQLMVETGGAISPADRLGAHLGLSELLLNSIEHGNLGITFEEKTAAQKPPEGLADLYRRRMADPELAERRVTVRFRLDEFGCEWTLSDEGRGFDWRGLPDPTTPEGQRMTHGRGVYLSRFQFDSLEYVGAGNIVRVRKALQPAVE